MFLKFAKKDVMEYAITISLRTSCWTYASVWPNVSPFLTIFIDIT